MRSALLVIAIVMLLCCRCEAQVLKPTYSNEEIITAIRQAEGSWTYGIKTIKCSTEKECRRICYNTIKNNRKRFANSKKHSGDFLHFLAGRYCPVKGRNLTALERKLNPNWEKNMRLILAKNRREK